MTVASWFSLNRYISTVKREQHERIGESASLRSSSLIMAGMDAANNYMWMLQSTPLCRGARP